MASAAFFVFFLLSHLVLLHSAEEEKKNPPPPDCSPFTCGKLGLITFPFKDTKHSDCGTFMVNCSQNRRFQTIQLKKGGPWFDVTNITVPPPTRLKPEITVAGYIKIHDRMLKKQLQTHNCNTLNSFTSPNSPYSFSFLPNHNLVKCFSNPGSNQSLDVYFHGYSSYKDCEGYSIYYNNSNNPSKPSGPLPHNCSVIDPPTPLIQNSRDLFTLLPDEFLLVYHVYVDYRECLSKGGQCRHDSWGNFRCSNLKMGKNKLSLILAIVIPGVVGILIICLLLFYCNRVALVETPNHQNVELFLRNCRSISPKRYSYSDVKKMTYSFKDKLSQGGYGGVFKGKLLDGCLVAVKVLNKSKGDGQEFVNEVASISRTSHVNIVTLLGFCFEGSKRALIYEFMPNGSLEKFIYENPSRDHQLGWETLYQIAIGIARVLEYLHRGCNTRILHFDIKPLNILLDEDFCPKISDFGLAKLCPKDESIVSMLDARGTAGYIAPEVFCRNIGRVSHKSDVYSYGMMVLEMVGGRKNLDLGVDHTSQIYFPYWVYKRLERGDELGLHGIMNEEENEKARKMVLVSLWCIQTDPSNRPPMGAGVEMLQGSHGSLQVPPRPFLSSPPRSQADSLTTVPLSSHRDSIIV